MKLKLFSITQKLFYISYIYIILISTRYLNLAKTKLSLIVRVSIVYLYFSVVVGAFKILSSRRGIYVNKYLISVKGGCSSLSIDITI